MKYKWKNGTRKYYRCLMFLRFNFFHEYINILISTRIILQNLADLSRFAASVCTYRVFLPLPSARHCLHSLTVCLYEPVPLALSTRSSRDDGIKPFVSFPKQSDWQRENLRLAEDQNCARSNYIKNS